MTTTELKQGNFISDGKKKFIAFGSQVDWIETINFSIAEADQTTAKGVKFSWQKGFATDSALEELKSNSSNASNLTQIITIGGFTPIDSSVPKLGAEHNTIVAISNAVIPVVTNTGVNGLNAGDVVRLFDVAGAHQICGIDFTVGLNTLTNTTFSLDFMSQIGTATLGSWARIVIPPSFVPSVEVITKITNAPEAEIHVSTENDYSVGEMLRVKVPDVYGMREINGLVAKVLEVVKWGAGAKIKVDLDTSTFTPFAFPIHSQVPFDKAELISIGTKASEPVPSLSYASYGMLLASGVNSPAGVAGNKIFWRAGKYFS